MKWMNRKFNFKSGFTLTEVLLAVMIVGLIGIALASLTRAAAREGGVGRSRIMLRNNLSTFTRTLRNDLAEASVVTYIQGDITSADGKMRLLQIGKNRKIDGTPIQPTDLVPSTWVVYCFKPGSDTSNIVPAGATRGGTIYRYETSGDVSADTCSKENAAIQHPLLENVKYIPSDSTENYPVPLFARNTFSRVAAPNMLTVKIITELPSTPIVNDVIEENFTTPMGY